MSTHSNNGGEGPNQLGGTDGQEFNGRTGSIDGNGEGEEDGPGQKMNTWNEPVFGKDAKLSEMKTVRDVPIRKSD